MDGDFISTDIRYRDGPLNIKTKPKIKRKPAASFFRPDLPSTNPSNSPDLPSTMPSILLPSTNHISGGVVASMCGSVIRGANSVIGVPDGGVSSVDIDAVGGDDYGNLYVASGGSVHTVEDGTNGVVLEGGVDVGAANTPVVGEDVNGGGNNIIHSENLAPTDNKGEKEKGNRCVGGENVGGANANVSGSVGGDESGEDVIVEGGGGEDVMGGVGGGPDGVSVGGGGASVSGGASISPIPLIPRRRLREILEHAQGECIMCCY